MRVIFVTDFDFHPPERHQVVVAYKRGWKGTVRRVCAEAAMEIGAAELDTDYYEGSNEIGELEDDGR